MPSAYQKKCPRCRTQSPISAEQCGECGHTFRTKFLKQCPRCGEPAALDAGQCARCGRLFRTRFPEVGPPTAPALAQPPPPLPAPAEPPSAAAAGPAPEPVTAPEPVPEPFFLPPGVLTQIYTPNPWLDLEPGRPPYFAEADLPVVGRHQERAGEPYRFRGDLSPEPFLGDPQAPILLLDEYPPLPAGFPGDPTDPELARRWIANLRHAPLAYPLFPLDPSVRERFGSDPLVRRLAFWVAGYGAERVARTFFRVHLCPYASRRFRPLEEALPSQAYSLELARAKVRSGCLTLLLRGAERWEALIPDLKQSGHRVLNPRFHSLAPPADGRKGNLSPETAAALHRILGESAPQPPIPGE